MAVKVVMPQMGYDMKEGRIVRWLKKEGDAVARGEAIAEIETDKATVEMEAYASGVLRRLLVPEGQMVAVGQAIGIIGERNEQLPEDLSAVAATAAAAAEGRPEKTATVPSAQPEAVVEAGEVKASPLARRLAAEKRIDLTRVRGTGPGGRITERDIMAYEEALKKAPAQPTEKAVATPAAVPAAAAPTEARPRVIELTRMRQAIARLTARSKRETPHFYVSAEVDMGTAMDLRMQLNHALEPRGIRISVNDLVVKACALALAKYPNFNASFREDKLEIHGAINIGIAIALEGDEGLIVPALLDCGGKSLVEMARAAKDLVERANQKKLKEQEYTAATFSVSNMGMFDVDAFTAIIFPPHAAVLAVGAVRERPVVRDGQVVAGRTMMVTLSVDHRVADGAQAARFLSEVKRLLEAPVSLLV
jgi:pyruvate dehydrogenase E2 component (dihydrolipoamide acetyltransferase)